MQCSLRALLLLAPLAACCPLPAQVNQPEREVAAAARPRPEPRLGELPGLYEQGPSRLCIVAGGKADGFALVIRGSDGASCSGSGSVSRAGGRLRFTMRGDSHCTWDAAIEGEAIRFTSGIDPGCAYYCGGGATLAGVHLQQRVAGRAAALQAKDLVGEPLCAEE